MRVVRRACLETLEDRRLLSFSPAVGYAVGRSPQSIVVADVNGDAEADLAVLNTQSSTVSVLLGNGNGTFQPAANFATGTSPNSLAVGDFNSDGKPDLATANAGGLSVLLNNGTGGFQAPAAIGTADNPLSVAVGDFNGDGKLDLAATSSFFQPGTWGYFGYYPGYDVSSASVLLGNGAGSFTPAGSTGIGNGSYGSLAVADFNGDGKQDLAAAAPDSYGVEVLFGTAGGTLSPASYAGSAQSSSIAADDVNGDGKADLLVAGAYLQGVVAFLGTGTGTFAPGQISPTGANPASAIVADFNRDGKTDVATGNSGDGTLSVLLGNGSGMFTPPVNLAPTPGPVALAVGDFNADGRPDVAAANGPADTASVLLNDGTWPATDAPRISVSDATISEGNTGTVTASFTASLSAAYAQTVTVRYATADGTATAAGGDYQAAAGALTFAPGETSKTIRIQANGDRLAEDTETFAVRVTDPVNAFIADGTGVGTILDDEPRITIDYAASVPEGNTGTTPLNFAVTLSAAYDVPVTVQYTTRDLTPEEEYWYGTSATAGTDYAAASGTVTFNPGQPLTQKITVPVNGDRVGENDESFFVTLSNPSANAAITNGLALGTIVNDEPYVSIGQGTTVVEGNSGTKTMSFPVTLSSASADPVTVNYATADGTATAGGDYQAASGTLTIPANQTSGTITVVVNGDRIGEYDEYLSVNLTGSTGAVLGNTSGSGTIQDDEPRFSINSVSLSEGNSGTKAMTFTVTLSNPYDQAVTVNFATEDGSATAADGDYVAKSGSLTFAAGQTSKTITVTIIGDKKKESDEYFFLLLSGPSTNSLAYSPTGLGSILNDDGGGNKGSGRNR